MFQNMFQCQDVEECKEEESNVGGEGPRLESKISGLIDATKGVLKLPVLQEETIPRSISI